MGGELLAWDQSAPGVGILLSYIFTLYVDGQRAGVLPYVRCSDEEGLTGYACSSELPTLSPGPHILQITATINGLESEPSAPLRVNVR